ncbi:hypothetical protein BDV96DRAFT_632194 [Lophiotrema nucula]|uniref:Mid2 domain-containing protein n=1 Tax=Lophiotrema nucula TaxID=690887 RepID=A0A6A5Z5W3_9PLEO|nr:hypothetical protein BDV96DRAFT_632194 [Lophiotrema nucula]
MYDRNLFLTLLASHHLLLVESKTPCYFPNGTQEVDDAYQPCSQISGHSSMCCGTNHAGAGDRNVADDVCETNGLCQNWQTLSNGTTIETRFRGSCTDQSWKSGECLRDVCTDDKWEDQDGHAFMVQCSDDTWCCGRNNEGCCGNAEEVFRLAATVGITSTTISHTSVSSSSTSVSTPLVQTTQDSVTATSSSPSDAHSSSLTTSSKIGIGVGIPIGVILVATLIGLWLLRRRKRTHVHEAPGYSAYAGSSQWPGNQEKYHSAVPTELPAQQDPVELHGGNSEVVAPARES